MHRGQKTSIDAIDLATVARRTVIEAQGERAYGLAVSPDGKQLLFTSNRSGREAPYVINPETGVTLRLSYDGDPPAP